MEIIGTIKKYKFLILAIFIIGFSVYIFNFDNPLFWDDDDWIVNNPFVHGFSHVKDIFTNNVLGGVGLDSNYYRPLLLLTFAFNYLISGIQPLSYHLVSNLLHIANGIWIFFLLQRLLRKKIASFIAALIFIIHPLQTEAVTYISGRGDPLNVFFMLGAIWLFLNEDRRSKLFSFIFMVLAILSRETAVMLPFYILVFYMTFISKDRFLLSLKHGLRKVLPYFGVSVIYGILRLTVLNFQNTLNFYNQANAYTDNISYRVFTFLGTLVTYVKLIFVPIGLHMERDTELITSVFNLKVLSVSAVLIGLIWLLRHLYIKGRDMDFKILFFGLSIFFINLGPSSGILASINAFLYEHWLYFGIFGVSAIAGFYIDKLWKIVREEKVGRLLILVIFIGYFGFFGVAAAKRNLAWGDPLSFYEDILRYSPDSVRINNNVGNIYNEQNDLKKAEFYYRRAIESEDTFAQPHYNLGVIRMNEGNFEAAKVEYIRAIELNPQFYYAHQNLAFIYAKEGSYVKAADVLEKVLTLRPFDPIIYYNLGLVYLAENNLDLAENILRRGLEVARTEEEKAVFEDILTRFK